jgi:choline-sulfatase
LRAQNLLFILSDEHSRDITGCYGNRLVKTPHLDALAARGTRFAWPYCNCPICVPSRASLATGRYVHEIGCWDNAHPPTTAARVAGAIG